MNLSIRRAREEDAASMVDLLNSIIREGMYTIMENEISVDEQIDFIRRFPQQGIFNVAVCNDTGRVMGMQDIMPVETASKTFGHVGEISTFVAPDMQGRGIGGGLARATFQAAREKGFRKISATIRGDNPRAIGFYVGQGFRVIGVAEKHAFVRGEYIDEILAEKILDHEQGEIMPTRAAGTFQVKLIPQSPEENVGDPSIGRMSLDKQFHGDLEGTSRGQMLAVRTDVEGSAGYVAMERVTGTLHGRSGTFALQHSGTMTRGAGELLITVVPDSGTGDLAGLAGRMTIEIVDGEHRYGFEYTLAGA